jgi:hypothetical protein
MMRQEAHGMTGNLAQFGEDLRLHLLRLQVSLENLNHLFSNGRIASGARLAARMAELQKAAGESADRSEIVRESLEACIERDAGISRETIARWVSKRQTARLHERADLLEQSAVVAVELAGLAAAEAERITMTAVTARREAMAVQIQHDGGSDL